MRVTPRVNAGAGVLAGNLRVTPRMIARLGVLVGLLPFLMFCSLFELVPIGNLLIGSVRGADGLTLEYLVRVFTVPTFQRAIVNSVAVSATGAILGGVIGTAVGYAIMQTRHERLRQVLIGMAAVCSHVGGISLGFAFITILGTSGLITLLFQTFGLDLLSFFSLYSVVGLVIVYLYFLVPLMVVLMMPTFAGLRREWREASDSLGGESHDFWRRVGIPVLAPSIAAGIVLLFASSMGAYGTAYALVGGRVNLITIQIGILRRGEIIFNPSQADALALVLLLSVAVAVGGYHVIQRRAQRWAHV